MESLLDLRIFHENLSLVFPSSSLELLNVYFYEYVFLENSFCVSIYLVFSYSVFDMFFSYFYDLLIWSSFRFTAKLRGKYRGFRILPYTSLPYTPCLTHPEAPQLSIYPTRAGHLLQLIPYNNTS